MKTRKEMLTVCVDHQIARGIIPADHKDFQIKKRLETMSWSECKTWFEQVNYLKGLEA